MGLVIGYWKLVISEGGINYQRNYFILQGMTTILKTGNKNYLEISRKKMNL
jgi:hypothetical protein